LPQPATTLSLTPLQIRLARQPTILLILAGKVDYFLTDTDILKARDAMQDLSIRVHYLSCASGVYRAPKRTDPPPEGK
jgi:hypothetical protein